jgi:hypothetical protein
LTGASPMTASLSAVGLQSAYDAAAAAWTLSTAGSAPEVFYSSLAADRAFVHELFLLEALAQQLQTVDAKATTTTAAAAAAAAAPQLIIAHCSALSALSAEYGRSGAKVAAAQALLDTALAALLNTPYTVKTTTAGDDATRPLRFTAQIISGQQLHPAAAAQPWEEIVAVRHLAGNNSSNTTAGNTTLIDITQYQLNLWTGVFFALLIFAAIYGVATMDIGRDSLLYAKFQADTTSKVD